MISHLVQWNLDLHWWQGTVQAKVNYFCDDPVEDFLLGDRLDQIHIALFAMYVWHLSPNKTRKCFRIMIIIKWNSSTFFGEWFSISIECIPRLAIDLTMSILILRLLAIRMTFYLNPLCEVRGTKWKFSADKLELKSATTFKPVLLCGHMKHGNFPFKEQFTAVFTIWFNTGTKLKYGTKSPCWIRTSVYANRKLGQ